jgi:hypothetical protein
MADSVSEFVAWSDNANEYADDLREKLKQRALEDIDNLMSDAGERDVDLWGSFDIDDDQVVSDYDGVAPQNRDLNWSLGLSAIAAASGIQFFLDSRDDMIIWPSAYRAQVMNPFNLTRDQLVRAGKRDVLRVTIDGYQKLQNQFVTQFSTLRNMSSSQLYFELQNIGGLQSFDKYVSDSMGYVSRMTSYPPGSPQFKSSVADLVNMQSTSAQQRMNRRSIESISVERQIDGNYDTLLCWVLDPTSSHCPYCPPRAGEVRTFAEWITEGLPGADVCKGGDRCNCHLVAV